MTAGLFDAKVTEDACWMVEQGGSSKAGTAGSAELFGHNLGEEAVEKAREVAGLDDYSDVMGGNGLIFWALRHKGVFPALVELATGSDLSSEHTYALPREVTVAVESKVDPTQEVERIIQSLGNPDQVVVKMVDEAHHLGVVAVPADQLADVLSVVRGEKEPMQGMSPFWAKMQSEAFVVQRLERGEPLLGKEATWRVFYNVYQDKQGETQISFHRGYPKLASVPLGSSQPQTLEQLNHMIVSSTGDDFIDGVADLGTDFLDDYTRKAFEIAKPTLLAGWSLAFQMCDENPCCPEQRFIEACLERAEDRNFTPTNRARFALLAFDLLDESFRQRYSSDYVEIPKHVRTSLNDRFWEVVKAPELAELVDWEKSRGGRLFMGGPNLPPVIESRRPGVTK